MPSYSDALENKRFTPQILNLMITERCNYRCIFCDFHKKYMEMPFDLAIKAISDAQNIGIRTVAFTGGEPLLYAKIFDLILLIKTYGMSPHITTNGSLVMKYIDKIRRSELDSISFSIDGIGETHDRLRGVKGSFEDIKNAMDFLRENTHILLFVNMVVTSLNVREIVDVYEFSKKMGATFFFWPVNEIDSLYLKGPESSIYLEAVDYICQRENCSKSVYNFLRRGIDYHLGRIRCFRCPAFYSTVNIYLNGEVMPCCVWGARDLSVGNINTGSLSEILNSSKAKDVVKGIFENGCCGRCYNSMLPVFSDMFGEDFIL